MGGIYFLSSLCSPRQIVGVWAGGSLYHLGQSLFAPNKTAVRRTGLAALSALIGSQRELNPNGQPVVTEIVVTEVAVADKYPQADKD
jgi:hypothetical protein